VMIHAPGAIAALRETDRSVEIRVTPWSRETSRVLISGIQMEPMVKIDGKSAVVTPVEEARSSGCWFDAEAGIMCISIQREARVDLEF